jgi:3-phenylpropionate/cinnamic acid dioxygenase small subunit
MEPAYAAIARLVFGYADRLDAGDLAGMAALFARATLRTASGEGATFTGSAEVLAAFDGSVQRFEDGTPATKHVTTNLIVDADEAAGNASARSYFTVLQSRPALPLQPIVAGRYEDSFARDADGQWHFADRLIVIEHVGDVSQHLRMPAAGEPAPTD